MSDSLLHNSDELNQCLSRELALVETQSRALIKNGKLEDIIQQFPERKLEDQHLNDSMLAMVRKLPDSYLKNPEFAKELLQRNHNAFDYLDKSLKQDKEFIKDAIKVNAGVYYHLTPEQKQDAEISERYMKKMIEPHKMPYDGLQRDCMPSPYRLDPQYPVNMQQYESDYIKTIANGIKMPETKVMETDEWKRLAKVRELANRDPELKDNIERVEKAVMESRSQKILELADVKSSIDNPNVAAILDAAREKMPELVPEIDRREDRRIEKDIQTAEYKHTWKRLNSPQRINPRTEQEAELNQADKEKDKRIRDRAKNISVEDSLMAYVKQSSMDYIYGLVSDGLISPDQASLQIGLISCIPSSALVRATANDFENGDFHMTPEEHATFSKNIDDLSHKLNIAELTIQEGLSIAYSAVQKAQEYEDQEYYEEYPYQDPKKQEKEKEKYRDPAFYAPEGYDQEMFHEWQPSNGKKK